MFDWFVLLTPLLLLPVVLLLVFVGCPLSHPALRADRFSLTFDTALVRIATVLFEFSLRRPDGGMNGPQIINVPVDDPTRPLDGVFFGGVRGELTRFIGSTRQKCGIVERGRLDDGEWTVRCGYTTTDGRRLLPAMGRTFTVDRMNAPPRVAFVVDPSRSLSVQLAPPPPMPPNEVAGPTISFAFDASRADVTRVRFDIEVLSGSTRESAPVSLRHDNMTSPPAPNPIGTFSGEHITAIGRSGGTQRYLLTSSRPIRSGWIEGSSWRLNVDGSFRDPRGGAETNIGINGSVRFDFMLERAGQVFGALRLAGDPPFRIEPGSLDP